MISLLKGIALGVLGGLIVPLLMHRISGAEGGVLAVQFIHLFGYSFWWSWPIFVIASGFAFAIFKMME